MKVLGIKMNKDNNLRAHVSAMNAKVTMTYQSLKTAVEYMTPEVRKIILNSKLRGQINMFLPLFINQSQGVKKQVEVLLMRINKLIYGKKYFRVSNETICKEIKMPLPEVEIVKATAKSIQKIMYNRKTPSIMKLITRTKRVTSNYYYHL